MNKYFQQLVEARGLDADFLDPKYNFDRSTILMMPDIEKAMIRIKKAILGHEKIMVYGDYDVDGVTATTLMKSILEMAGAKEVITMLPDRFIDGYGMSNRLVKQAVSDSVSLIVTVDCGSNNSAIIEELSKQKIDVIVTDHHEVMGLLPKCVAIINPKRKDVDNVSELHKSGLADLAGVGVAFMVALALSDAGLIKTGQEKWLLDLVVIGTICDNMEMSKINRILCYFGMIVLSKTKRVGLVELMKMLSSREVNSRMIGFQIGPRLNAGGRMETAEISLKLLMTQSRMEAANLARKLEDLNSERKKEQQDALDEIGDLSKLEQHVIVVSGKWHEGVLGIIAGKLQEKYHKPTFVLSEVESDVNLDGIKSETEKILKGSGRSFGDFNLAEAIKACSGTIISGGGHSAACGIKLKIADLPKFIQEINDYYESLNLKNQDKFFAIKPDIVIENFKDLDVELCEEIKKLEPFGQGNSEPVFMLKDFRVAKRNVMGKDNQHISFILNDKNREIKICAFYAEQSLFDIEQNSYIDAKITLSLNEWNGLKNVEGIIVEISSCKEEAYLV